MARTGEPETNARICGWLLTAAMIAVAITSEPALAADEAAVVNYGREFFRTRRVSRGAFQAALEQLGRQGVIELALVMGNYSLLALLINSFDTDLPPDRTEPLLPV